MPRKILLNILGFFLFLVAPSAIGQTQEDRQSKNPPPSETAAPKGGQSFLADVFGNARQKFAFSLGGLGMYESNVFNRNQNVEDAIVTAILARVSVNLGRRNTRFHAEYGFGYRIYNARGSLNGSDHYGNVHFTHQLSRRLLLQVSDQVSSSPNGFRSLMSPIFSPESPSPGFASDPFLARQRITQNFVSGNLDWQLSRKFRIGAFGNYNTYLFQTQDLRNVTGVQVGASYGYSPTNWLSLSGSYATYLNKVDPSYRELQIHRVQVGGFEFKLGKAWRAAISGGVEFTNYFGQNRFTEYVSGGLSWHSETSTLSVSYHRGFFSTIGIPQLFQSQLVNVGFGNRLASWVNLQMAGSYIHGLEYSQSGQLDQYFGYGGLDFALRADLVASLYGGYQQQRARDLAGLPANREGYVAYLGLQYLFPAFRR